MSPGLGWPLSLEVDWAQARMSGLLEVFAAEVQAGLAPLLNNTYEDAEQLDEGIELVARILVDAAERPLPLNNQEGGKMIHCSC